MPFFLFEMYRMEENLVYYQLFILLVVSGSLNVNHLYRGVTTLSIEDYLNTHHTLYPAGSRVSPTVPGGRGWGGGGAGYIANTTHRSRVPKRNPNFGAFLYILIKYLYYTLKSTFKLTSYGLYTVVMCNFRKVKL